MQSIFISLLFFTVTASAQSTISASDSGSTLTFTITDQEFDPFTAGEIWAKMVTENAVKSIETSNLNIKCWTFEDSNPQLPRATCTLQIGKSKITKSAGNYAAIIDSDEAEQIMQFLNPGDQQVDAYGGKFAFIASREEKIILIAVDESILTN